MEIRFHIKVVDKQQDELNRNNFQENFVANVGKVIR